jgi:hypothetical protein
MLTAYPVLDGRLYNRGKTVIVEAGRAGDADCTQIPVFSVILLPGTTGPDVPVTLLYINTNASGNALFTSPVLQDPYTGVQQVQVNDVVLPSNILVSDLPLPLFGLDGASCVARETCLAV